MKLLADEHFVRDFCIMWNHILLCKMNEVRLDQDGMVIVGGFMYEFFFVYAVDDCWQVVAIATAHPVRLLSLVSINRRKMFSIAVDPWVTPHT